MKKCTAFFAFLILLSLTLFSGCKKFLDVPPPGGQLTRNIIYDDAKTIDATVAGMYSNTLNTFANLGFNVYFFADELYVSDNGYDAYRNNAYTAKDYIIAYMWQSFYQELYQANDIIDGIQGATVISAQQKKHYAGEAKFFRAFCLLELTNLFDRIPLVLTPDSKAAATLPQSSRDSVLQQVALDLAAAADDLGDVASPKSRVTGAAATALLARVWLYSKNWSSAEAAASAVINSGQFFLEPDVNHVFLRSSNESIFQQASKGGNPAQVDYTADGAAFVAIPGVPPYYNVDSNLVGSFEPGDLRASSWIYTQQIDGIDYYSPSKYKQNSTPVNSSDAEDFVILRLAEMYLIRSEARAQLGNIEGALTDVDAIRARAGLPPLDNNITKSDLLLAIEHERRSELFLESGHRWFDLNRTGRADAVLGMEKPFWRSTAVWLPIPSAELAANHKLSQNPGY